MTFATLQHIADDIYRAKTRLDLERIIFSHAGRREALSIWEGDIRYNEMRHELKFGTVIFQAARWVPDGLAAFVYANGDMFLAHLTNYNGFIEMHDMKYVKPS